jgi:hypothetical protein
MNKRSISGAVRGMVLVSLIGAQVPRAESIRPTAPVSGVRGVMTGMFLCDRRGQVQGEPQTVQKTPDPKSLPLTVQISLSVEGDLLVTAPNGKSIGFDPRRNKAVNDIANARIINRENSSTYVLPFDNSGKPYVIVARARTAGADLTMTGPGFLVGFKGLPSSSTESSTFGIGSDGRLLSFTAGPEARTPELFITLQSGRGKPSYKFEISPPRLAPGRSVSVKVDPENGKFYFQDDDPAKGKYELLFRRTNAGGSRNTYLRRDISIGANDNYSMDFAGWDGKGDMCFYADENGSGFKNRQCVKLSNQNPGPGIQPS